MKREEIGAPGGPPNFIGTWRVEPAALCDDLIGFFESNPGRQRSGETGGGVNAASKRSTDITIRPRDLANVDHLPVRRYFDELFACYRDYLVQWPFYADLGFRIAIGSFNIQRYTPGGHFRQVHCERTSWASLHRVLAWMTYLNDVDDGGSTSFTHYGLDVQPRKGRTMIWPADWTHAHTGNVVNSGVKYIMTGWMHLDIE